MRDMTRETVEAIDQTRMDMAGVEGVLTWVQHLADRNKDGDMDSIKQLVKEQRAALTALRKGLNKARFDNAYSPLGFELESSDADPWASKNLRE
jgi:hypothetical protein